MVAPDDPRAELCAYAKLEGDGIEYYVRKYEIVLGRASKGAQADVVLGDNMNISRQHAKIAYNPSTSCFELVVLGKNGVTVGNTLYTPASPPYQLKSTDMLVVADKVFFFLLPKAPSQITRLDLEQLNQAAMANKRQKLFQQQHAQPVVGMA